MADSGTELAKAYVQIVPSARGISGQISEELGGEAESAGKDAGNKIISGIKKVIVAAGIGKILKDSVMAGADLQQSIGGIETLFGAGGRSIEEYAAKMGKSVEEVSDKYAVLQQAQELALSNARKAYQTAGLSANDYMQTVTSFAAALKASAKDELDAARIADQAIIDMSDNANKMGTDMQAIQNAYQGFAKQNYTMLDNLKLGYGGTQSEMQRLLKDASKISGIKYDINNLSDVYEAIHVIQGQLDITGTTAKEAASTFSGSLAAMKAAGQNVLASLSLGEDIAPALNGLMGTVVAFVQNNAIPMVLNILKGIPEILISALDWAGSMGGSLGDLVINLITTVVDTITTNAPRVFDAGVNVFSKLMDGISNLIPRIIQIGVNLLTSLLTNLPQIIQTLTPKVTQIITSIIQTIIKAAPQIIQAGITLLTSLVKNLPAIIAGIIKAIPQIIRGIITAISGAGGQMVEAGKNLLLGLGSGLISGVTSVVRKAKEAAGKVLSAVKGFFGIHSPSTVFAGLGEMLNLGLAEGISDSIGPVQRAMNEVARTTTGTFEAGVDVNYSRRAAGDASGLAEMIGVSSPVINIYQQPGEDAEQLAAKVQRVLVAQQNRKAMAW